MLTTALIAVRSRSHAFATTAAVSAVWSSTLRTAVAVRAPAVASSGPLPRHPRRIHSCAQLCSAASPYSAPSSAAAASSIDVGIASLPGDLSKLASGILSGDRLSLSRAITLIESIHPKHILQAQQLLAALAHERQKREVAQARPADASNDAAADPASPATVAAEELTLKQKRALRIGISGPPGQSSACAPPAANDARSNAGRSLGSSLLPCVSHHKRTLTERGIADVLLPGVGKSTFIEALGRFLLSHGHRLAVLSIDPSSHVTGGSILGDKTRMAELARHPDAYVRPSPSKCVLGGVAAATYDTVLLCEHAGFSLVLVETVGVGQSEVSVHSMVDLLILLVQPGGGDELQGMKKGIVELIDLVVVNKADGELLAAARHTKLDYAHALQLNTQRKKQTDWKPIVKMCSSVNETTGGQSVHAQPREVDASSSTGSSAVASSPSSQSSVSRQHSQLRDIWLSICSFDVWSRGPFGDFYLRRAKQTESLLKQALSDNVTARLLHALQHITAYQLVQRQLETQAKAQQQQNAASTLAQGSSADSAPAVLPPPAEVIPRVAAQRIVDEWITREASNVQQGADRK